MPGDATCTASPQGRALIDAVQADDEPRVRALLAAGADPRTRMDCSEPLFLHAARTNKTGILKAFLDHGLPPDEFTDNANRTALQLCAMAMNREAVKLLLDKGANPFCDIHEDGFTLLHFVAFNNDTELCVKLLELGADPHARTKLDEDVFDYAGEEAAAAMRAHISLKKSRRLHNLRKHRPPGPSPLKV